jgi:hypothetical protein
MTGKPENIQMKPIPRTDLYGHTQRGARFNAQSTEGPLSSPRLGA